MSQIICPICRRPFESETSPAMPFCSQRCQLVDLGRWLGQQYSVPCAPKDEAGDGEEPPLDPSGKGDAD